MLARVPNYIKTLGVGAGLATFGRMYRPGQVAAAPLRVPIGARTMWLRNTPSDKSIFFQVLIKQEYDTTLWPAQHARLQQRYSTLLAAGRVPVVIDAGANIGCAAVWFAERYPQARIVAIEPDAGNLALLRQNADVFHNISVVAGAVWDRATRLRISNPTAGAGAFRVEEGVGELPAYTIDGLVAQIPGAELLIAKIDIEGGEAALFRSNTGWIDDAALIVAETHDWLFPGAETSRNLRRCIAERRVDLLFRGENLFCFRHD